jgi:hypothetical protein
VQVRVLGPLQVNLDGRVWSPGGPKERRLLAILVLHIGEVVSVDALAEAPWDGGRVVAGGTRSRRPADLRPGRGTGLAA